MPQVTFTRETLCGDHTFAKGDTLAVSKERAEHLIKSKAAVLADGDEAAEESEEPEARSEEGAGDHADTPPAKPKRTRKPKPE